MVMVDTMPEMTREFLEAKSLQAARQALGCGPSWYPSEFVPPLPPVAEKEARLAILPLTCRYALMRS